MLVNTRPANRQDPPFDAEASLREARARLPLRRLMEQHGVQGTDRKTFKCPFCGANGAGFFTKEGQEFFKCFHTSCPIDTKALDEVGFIMALQPALNRKEAFMVFLKDAGVWKERTKLKGKGNALARGPKVSPAPLPPAEGASPSTAPVTEGEPIKSSAAGMSDPAAVTAQVETSSPSAGTSPAREAGVPTTPAQSGNASPSVASSTGPYPAGSDDGEAAVKSDAATATPEPPVPAPPASPAPKTTPDGSPVVVEVAFSKEKGSAGKEGADELPEATALDVVRAFYDGLHLSEQDEERLWMKRGLTSRTSDLLGFRSGLRSNKELLVRLRERFEMDVLLESGLWKRGGKEGHRAAPKPNAQFYGMGMAGKLKNLGGKAAPDQVVDDDGNVWGWCEPILIPYRDERGRLIKLRPHKGGAPGDTVCGEPMLYVPRPEAGYDARLPRREFGRGGPMVVGDGKAEGLPYAERFRTVLITEGEFKAAAAWQAIGPGRVDGGRAVGVCAVPGIQFANHYAVFEELEAFVRRAGAERVMVVFDNEDKANPALPGFKSDWRQRHDAAIWAGVLATKLYERVHPRQAAVGTLDEALRDAGGKADIDGMARKYLHGE